MRSYTTILVLALAVSNVSPALSAPILQVREQSLSHRGPKVGATPIKRFAWGKLLKKVAIDLGIGTASTVAGYAALDELTGPSKSSDATEAAPPPQPAAAAPPPQPAAASPPPQPAAAAPPPPPAAAAPPPSPSSYAPPFYGSNAPNSNQGNSPSSNQSNTPNSSQSNTPNSNSGTDSGTSSSVFARSVSNRRVTPALELLSRSDLETLNLFKRILDELD